VIFPVGIEDAKLRRLPWFSILVVVLCVAVFGWRMLSPSAKGPGIQDVQTVWLEGVLSGHIEAELPEGCSLDESQAEGLKQVFEDYGLIGELDAGGTFAPTDGRTTQDVQTELDALCEEALTLSGGDPVYAYGLVPAKGLAQPGWLTHMLLHDGWFHIIGNILFFVLLCGPFMEDVWGTPIFGVFFLVGGVVAGVAQVALDPTSSVPIIGASGAISAAMGAFCVRFAKRKIGFVWFFIVLIRPMWGHFKVPALLVGGFWLAQDIFYQLMFGDVGGVAYMAHIGGMVFGAGVAAVFQFLDVEDRWGHPLDEGYQLGADSREERLAKAQRLGVPIEALSPPPSKDLDPSIRDIYEKALAALKSGDGRMGSRRLRWLVERGVRPRDDSALRHLVATYSEQLQPVHLTPSVLRQLVSVAVDYRLNGPAQNVRELLHELLDTPSTTRDDPDETDWGTSSSSELDEPAPQSMAEPPAPPPRDSGRPPDHQTALADDRPSARYPESETTPLPLPKQSETTSGPVDPVAAARSSEAAATPTSSERAVPSTPLVGPDGVEGLDLSKTFGLPAPENHYDPFAGLADTPSQDNPFDSDLEDTPIPDLDAIDKALASVSTEMARDHAEEEVLVDASTSVSSPSPTRNWGRPTIQRGRFQFPPGYRPRPHRRSLIRIEEDVIIVADGDHYERIAVEAIRAVAVAVVTQDREGHPHSVITDVIYEPSVGPTHVALVRLPFHRMSRSALAPIHERPDFAHVEFLRVLVNMGISGLPSDAEVRSAMFPNFPDETAMEEGIYGAPAPLEP